MRDHIKDRLMDATYKDGSGINNCPFCGKPYKNKEYQAEDKRGALGVIYYTFECCKNKLVRNASPYDLEV